MSHEESKARPVLMTRDGFRNTVFNRDDHKCVICGDSTSFDAHHIIERRLWDNGGYYINNGATLCGKHHIEAEQTILTCEEIRAAAGITTTLLPPHFYDDVKWDKWGNILLPDGRRVKGELFFDSSVQKILASANLLEEFCKYVKYPRTYHLPWSEGVGKDDRVLASTECFEGKRVIASIKMDGENTSLYSDYLHARSIDGNHHPSQSWVKNLHYQIGYNIPEGWRVCGENLYAKHTIAYNNLSTYFRVFSIWNENNECLDWLETLEWIGLLGLQPVNVIYTGVWDEKKIKNLYAPSYNGNICEGFVVRLFDSFTYGQFRNSVAKFVALKFKNELSQATYNWRYRQVVPNAL